MDKVVFKFTLNDKDYIAPSGWCDIKFSKFLAYLKDIAPLMPKCLVNVHSSDNPLLEYEKLSKTDLSKCYEFYAHYVGFWFNIPIALIRESMDIKQHLEPAYFAIQAALYTSKSTFDDSFNGFEIQGIEYVLPLRHMHGCTVAEFTEAAQFEANMEKVENGNYLAMLDVMVVLCRPKGEPYDYNEAVHNRRKRLFSDLTMDVIFNVGFFLLKLRHTLNLNLLIYGMMQDKAAQEARQ